MPKNVTVGNYIVEAYIGEGAFGRVLKAIDKKDVNKEKKKLFAIKTMERIVITDGMLDQEVNALKQFSHPNIVKLHEIIHTPQQLCLVQEHSGYSLWDASPAYADNGPKIKKILSQLVSALHHIHEKGYVHRDISPGNVLLSGETLDKVTIIDLGMTRRFITNREEHKLVSVCGTDGYNAPEMRYNNTFAHQTYSGKALDLWSCGAILHYMIYGKEPFHGKEDYFAYSENTEVIFSSEEPGANYFSDYNVAKHLMSKMLIKSPNQRYTWEEVMRHPFIKDYDDYFREQFQCLLPNRTRPPLETRVDTSIKEEEVYQLKKEAEELRMYRRTPPSLDEKLENANKISFQRRIKGIIHTPIDFGSAVYPQFKASEEPKPIPDNKYGGVGIYNLCAPLGFQLPHPRDVLGQAKFDEMVKACSPKRVLNEKNEMPNRIEYFLDDAAAPYKVQPDVITPFYGPPRKRVSPLYGPPLKRPSPLYDSSVDKISSPAESNSLLKRKPVPQVKDKAPSVLAMPGPVPDEIPFNSEKPISSNVIVLSDNCTPESAANKLFVADEALASAENKASSDHASPSLERNVLPTDPITPASFSLKLSKVTVTKLSPHTGKISPRTITSKSPCKMLRSIKDVLDNMGILSHMSGHQKMKCYRPQCEESSILTRIQDAVCGLLFGDQGKDIRFTIQLNRLNNVPGFYTVNIKHIQGSKTIFKVLRKDILDSLNLYN